MNPNNDTATFDEKLQPLRNSIANRNFRQAKRIGQQLLERYPDNSEVFAWLASAYYELGDLAQTELLCQRAIALNNKLVIPYLKLGQVYWRRREYQQAHYYLQQALELTPDNASIYASMGLVKGEEQQNEAAAQLLIQAAQLAPQEGWIQFALGWVLEKGGYYQQALAAYQRGITLDRSVDSYWQYAQAWGRIHGLFPILWLLYPLIWFARLLPLQLFIPVAVIYIGSCLTIAILYHRDGQTRKGIEFFVLASLLFSPALG